MIVKACGEEQLIKKGNNIKKIKLEENKEKRNKRKKKKDREEHTVFDNSSRLLLLADAAPKNEVAIDLSLSSV